MKKLLGIVLFFIGIGQGYGQNFVTMGGFYTNQEQQLSVIMETGTDFTFTLELDRDKCGAKVEGSGKIRPNAKNKRIGEATVKLPECIVKFTFTQSSAGTFAKIKTTGCEGDGEGCTLGGNFEMVEAYGTD